jgi:hypothetical protein
VEVDENPVNNKPVVNNKKPQRKKIRKTKQKMDTKNMVPPSSAGNKAEFHNRLNSMLNSHIMNNK